MFKIFFVICIIEATKSEKFFGSNNYIEYEMGNLNILISVPHDGRLFAKSMPNRTNDKNLLRDVNSRPLAEAFATRINSLFGLKPFMVFNKLHRQNMDPNRDFDLCCSNLTLNLDCHKAHGEYHHFIKDYVKKMSSVYKNLLIFDIHGQAHPEDWIELGYLLDRIELNKDVLSETRFSSINALKVSSGYSLEEAIRGRASLGAFMNQQGFRVVPSPSIKSPGKGKYFPGGFISSYHKSPNVNAIQMEFPSSLRTYLDSFKNDGARLAKSVYDFYKFNNFDLKL